MLERLKEKLPQDLLPARKIQETIDAAIHADHWKSATEGLLLAGSPVGRMCCPLSYLST
jgi:hypothetical protein